MNDIAERAMRRTMANSSKRAGKAALKRLARQAEDRAIRTGEPLGAVLSKLINRERQVRNFPGVEPLPASDTPVSKKDRERQRVIARLRQEAEAKAHQEGRPFEEVFERLKEEYRRYKVLAGS